MCSGICQGFGGGDLLPLFQDISINATLTFKDEAQTALFKDPVRTAL